jgi:carbon-monoxide dehydrogenase medium subunit
MYQFAYHRPQSLDAAVALLKEGEDVKLLAGGHTLLPTMKQRLAAPGALIDLNAVPGLSGISMKDGKIAIGAMTRHAAVASSDLLAKEFPVLAEFAGLIGDPAVRHRGTIGGSIANNDPAADYPAACLALGATIVTNQRSLPAAEFFTGLFETALEEGEIVTEILFPKPAKSAWQKFRNPASRYAIVGVFVAQIDGEVRVAVTGAGASGVFRVPQFEAALSGNFSAAALEGVTVDPDGLNSDIHADAAYRAHLINVLARRAVAAAK